MSPKTHRSPLRGPRANRGPLGSFNWPFCKLKFTIEIGPFCLDSIKFITALVIMQLFYSGVDSPSVRVQLRRLSIILSTCSTVRAQRSIVTYILVISYITLCNEYQTDKSHHPLAVYWKVCADFNFSENYRAIYKLFGISK